MENQALPKAKKELTVKQRYNRLLVGKWSFFASKYLTILTPYIIIFSINFEQYFMSAEGWKVSLGASMAFMMMGIAMIKTAKKDSKKLIPNSSDSITFMLGWAIAMAIFYFLSSILLDIAMIMFYGLLGLIGGFGFDRAYSEFNRRALLFRDAMEKNEIDKMLEKEDLKQNENETLPTE